MTAPLQNYNHLPITMKPLINNTFGHCDRCDKWGNPTITFNILHPENGRARGNFEYCELCLKHIISVFQDNYAMIMNHNRKNGK